MKLPVFFAALAPVLLVACASNPTSIPEGMGFDEFVAALRARGVSADPAGTVSQPFFSVSGRVVRVAGEEVQTFEFPTMTAARTEASRISPDGGGVGTTLITWTAPPHFFQRDRLIVLYVGSKADVLASLQDVAGAQVAGR